jgi:hypothetical protein
MALDKIASLLYLVMLVVFFLGGITLILLAIRRAVPIGNRPLAINASKLGLDIKTDTVGLLILVGVVFIGLGPFFAYRGYERRLSALQRQLDDSNANYREVLNQLKQFKIYDAKLNLAFPAEAHVDPRDVVVQLAVTRPGQTPKLVTPEQYVGPGDLWIELDNVALGDKIRVIANEKDGESERKWESEEIEIPKSQVAMRRTGR